MSKQAEDFYMEQKFSYDQFTKLTSTGIEPDDKAIAEFAQAYHESRVNAVMPNDLDAMDEYNRLEQWCLDNETRKPQQKSFMSGYRFVKQLLNK